MNKIVYHFQPKKSVKRSSRGIVKILLRLGVSRENMNEVKSYLIQKKIITYKEIIEFSRELELNPWNQLNPAQQILFAAKNRYHPVVRKVKWFVDWANFLSDGVNWLFDIAGVIAVLAVFFWKVGKALFPPDEKWLATWYATVFGLATTIVTVKAVVEVLKTEKQKRYKFFCFVKAFISKYYKFGVFLAALPEVKELLSDFKDEGSWALVVFFGIVVIVFLSIKPFVKREKYGQFKEEDEAPLQIGRRNADTVIPSETIPLVGDRKN
eukprot:TRINITY_DN2689_c0_g1_i3.p1 TRINITY_DN2689_c0_g1~~TRINITY_DN2689_c0_g1_i3.p1  ORF type:complete len:267 (-),score=50.15 TRINITY_DN2689_c0_g1_i3:288-1088(-)